MAKQSLENELLLRISKFCHAERISKTAFGIQAMKDPRFILDLERGREVRRKTRQRLEAFMVNRKVGNPKKAEAPKKRRKAA